MSAEAKPTALSKYIKDLNLKKAIKEQFTADVMENDLTTPELLEELAEKSVAERIVRMPGLGNPDNAELYQILDNPSIKDLLAKFPDRKDTFTESVLTSAASYPISPNKRAEFDNAPRAIKDIIGTALRGNLVKAGQEFWNSLSTKSPLAFIGPRGHVSASSREKIEGQMRLGSQLPAGLDVGGAAMAGMGAFGFGGILATLPAALLTGERNDLLRDRYLSGALAITSLASVLGIGITAVNHQLTPGREEAAALASAQVQDAGDAFLQRQKSNQDKILLPKMEEWAAKNYSQARNQSENKEIKKETRIEGLNEDNVNAVFALLILQPTGQGNYTFSADEQAVLDAADRWKAIAQPPISIEQEEKINQDITGGFNFDTGSLYKVGENFYIPAKDLKSYVEFEQKTGNFIISKKSWAAIETTLLSNAAGDVQAAKKALESMKNNFNALNENQKKAMIELVVAAKGLELTAAGKTLSNIGLALGKLNPLEHPLGSIQKFGAAAWSKDGLISAIALAVSIVTTLSVGKTLKKEGVDRSTDTENSTYDTFVLLLSGYIKDNPRPLEKQKKTKLETATWLLEALKDGSIVVEPNLTKVLYVESPKMLAGAGAFDTDFFNNLQKYKAKTEVAEALKELKDQSPMARLEKQLAEKGEKIAELAEEFEKKDKLFKNTPKSNAREWITLDDRLTLLATQIPNLRKEQQDLIEQLSTASSKPEIPLALYEKAIKEAQMTQEEIMDNFELPSSVAVTKKGNATAPLEKIIIQGEAVSYPIDQKTLQPLFYQTQTKENRIKINANGVGTQLSVQEFGALSDIQSILPKAIEFSSGNDALIFAQVANSGETPLTPIPASPEASAFYLQKAGMGGTPWVVEQTKAVTVFPYTCTGDKAETTMLHIPEHVFNACAADITVALTTAKENPITAVLDVLAKADPSYAAENPAAQKTYLIELLKQQNPGHPAVANYQGTEAESDNSGVFGRGRGENLNFLRRGSMSD